MLQRFGREVQKELCKRRIFVSLRYVHGGDSTTCSERVSTVI